MRFEMKCPDARSVLFDHEKSKWHFDRVFCSKAEDYKVRYHPLYTETVTN